MTSTIHTHLTEELRKEWYGLWNSAAAADVSNSPGWFEAACEAFGYTDVRILAVRDESNGLLRALVALVKIKKYGISLYTIPGLEFVSRFTLLADLADPLLRKEILSQLCLLGTVYLSGLQESAVEKLSEETSEAVCFATDKDFAIDLKKGPYGEMTGSKKIRNVQNRLKRAEEEVRFQIVSENHMEFLQQCFEIDQISTKDEKGKGVFWREDARQFYSKLAEYNSTNISIALLYFGSKAVAYTIFFSVKGAYIGSQKAYVSGYEYYNLGFISFIKFLDKVAPQRPKEINLGRGYDRFKIDFTKESRVLYSAVISNDWLVRGFLRTLEETKERVYRVLVLHPGLYANYKFLLRGRLPHKNTVWQKA